MNKRNRASRNEKNKRKPRFYEKGKRFGRWTTLQKIKPDQKFCRCICNCGVKRTVNKRLLFSKQSRSCGCLHSEVAAKTMKKNIKGKNGKYHNRFKHGHAQIRAGISKTYSSWEPIKRYVKQMSSEVSVCERWNDFRKFLEDMGEKPPGTRFARHDKEEGYYKENCYWRAIGVKGKKGIVEGIRK